MNMYLSVLQDLLQAISLTMSILLITILETSTSTEYQDYGSKSDSTNHQSQDLQLHPPTFHLSLYS